MPTSSPTTQNTLTDLLSHLIRMPTLTSDPATNGAALDWVEEQLKETGLNIARFVNHGHPALLAVSPGTADPKNPRLWLAGHVDVVPGATSQFEPKLSSGNLLGRGAFDMKGAVAIYIALAQELAEPLSDYDFGIMLTTDEELGGFHGVNWLINECGYRGQAVLLPECGTSWSIETGAKGIMSWKLQSRGRASHASRPWEGVNAIDQLTRFITQLQRAVPSEPCGDAAHAHATISLGQISGGEVANQVPEFASALVDVRFTAGTSLDDVKAWFAEAALKAPGVAAESVIGSPAYLNPLDGPATLFHNIAHEVTGHSLTPMLSHGSSDGRFFAAHNIPVITVPPIGGGQHSDDEWVKLSGLADYYEMTRRFIESWASTRA